MIHEIRINPPVATYREVAVLDDLRRVNFIFGSNGVGKTTISRVIEQAVGHQHCQLVWQHQNPLQVMVYNRDFVQRNFEQSSNLAGVFTLGENQVQAEQEIARLQKELDKHTDDINKLNVHLAGVDGQRGKKAELLLLETQLKESCWQQKQRYDEFFQVAFTGFRASAEKFKEKVLSEHHSNTADLLTFDVLNEKAKTVFDDAVQGVSLLNSVDTKAFNDLHETPVLNKSVVGNEDVDIAGLIKHLGNSDWVKQGMHYHAAEPSICPFCQQATPESFAKSLQEFFSDTYANELQKITTVHQSYQQLAQQILHSAEINLSIQNHFLDKALYTAHLQTLGELLQSNISLLSKKMAEPSHKIELHPVEERLAELQSIITAANTLALEHNQIVANRTAEKSLLTQQIWRFVVNDLSTTLSQYLKNKVRLTKAISGMEASIAAKNAQLANFNAELHQWQRQATSTLPTVTAINQLLISFGFLSFSISTSEDQRHYQIVRANGADASRSLSEGEKTFITFLYFYYLIKGSTHTDSVSSPRVVVFDDPISSLDSDILYIVSSLIKGIIAECRSDQSQIKQVFLLTHNVYFHKEITYNPSRPANAVLSDESFWLVKKSQFSSVERCTENPIRSAYELLWDDVKTSNVSSISLQNTLRRILENYFTMWGGMKKDEICELFDGREKLICQSLFSWVNDGSHSIHDDLYINQGTQTNAAYLQVFKNIFVRAGQIGHYNMMVCHSDTLDPHTALAAAASMPEVVTDSAMPPVESELIEQR
ncbi:AAA family ATPase [Vibrio cholerae]|uniref:AAA family ATPase n=1 Tax=Vibrio cholerae TaxID=666 RepID=UPI002D911FBA|nr:AAA family ATPase [Vibrio cholerae]MEB5596970.1 AAA family ATPase [Vibrio cholerae]